MDVSIIGLNGLYANSASKSGNLDGATNRLIKDKDKDGDGTLSAVEILISEEAFKLADANNDGELDAEELRASAETIAQELKQDGPVGLPPQMENKDDDEEDDQTSTLIDALFNQADANGDGSLSKDEVSVSSKVFDSIDTNKDGVISYDELLAASQANSQEQGAEGASSRKNLFEQLFSAKSGDNDATETTVDRIA
ncbi:MAG: EF-hand domain-containing protein [Solirubrobacterales bacterium]